MILSPEMRNIHDERGVEGVELRIDNIGAWQI